MIGTTLLVFGVVIIAYLRKVKYGFEGVKKLTKKAEIEAKKEKEQREEALKEIPAKIHQTEKTEELKTRKKCPFCGAEVESSEIKCPKCGGII